MKKSILTATIIGNALEYYDFTIFAVFSSEIGKTFFPSEDDFARLLLSLAVFAVGFLMRPLGGIIFGHIGDTLGRRRALTVSIACMALPTCLMGVLPGYDQWGIYAPLVLVILRLIQGTSIGGEGAGSAIFILEHNPDLKQNTLASIVTASNILGAFVATLTGLLLAYFFPNTLGFRYAFIFGGLLGLFGLYLRLTALETPIFTQLESKGEILNLPILKIIKENRKQILLSVCLGGIAGAIAYTMLAYINLFFSKILGLHTYEALVYASVGIASYILFLPIFGHYSDRFGGKTVLLFGCVAVAISAIPAFMMMTSSNFLMTITGILLLGALAGAVCAPAYPLMLTLFPDSQRYSGVAFSFNTGIALFGGTAPIVAASLTKTTGLIYAPAFYLVGLALLFLLSFFIYYLITTIPTDSRLSSLMSSGK